MHARLRGDQAIHKSCALGRAYVDESVFRFNHRQKGEWGIVWARLDFSEYPLWWEMSYRIPYSGGDYRSPRTVPDAAPQPAKSLKFHYIKSNHFRVIHVDGALGGPTPVGLIHIALYSERFPIPLQSVHEIKEGIVQSMPTESVSRDGIVREVEADLIMTPSVARTLAAWINDNLGRLEALAGKKGSE